MSIPFQLLVWHLLKMLIVVSSHLLVFLYVLLAHLIYLLALRRILVLVTVFPWDLAQRYGLKYFTLKLAKLTRKGR